MKHLLLFFILSSSLQLSAHKFYMSITEMSINPKNNALEVSIKFFTDDLENALEQNVPYPILLSTEKESSETDSILQSYLGKHFNLYQNKKKMNIDFLGKESERDYTWVYIEVRNLNSKKRIVVHNTLLISLFEDQVNRVNFKNKDYSKSVNLHLNLTKAEF